MWRRTLRGVSVSAALGAVVACSGQSQTSVEARDAGSADPDGGRGGDAPVPARDGGVDARTSEDDSSIGRGCTGKIVINELQCNGPDGAEFIELFNPNDCAINLAAWKIPYRAPSGNAGPAIHSFEPGDTIPARAFLLVANASFDGGPTVAEFNGGGRLGNTGGQVALVDENDNQIDAVGYGPSTAGTYVEQSPAPVPSGSASIGRKSDGLDTDDNASDFTMFTNASPGVAN